MCYVWMNIFPFNLIPFIYYGLCTPIVQVNTYRKIVYWQLGFLVFRDVILDMPFHISLYKYIRIRKIVNHKHVCWWLVVKFAVTLPPRCKLLSCLHHYHRALCKRPQAGNGCPSHQFLRHLQFIWSRAQNKKNAPYSFVHHNLLAEIIGLTIFKRPASGEYCGWLRNLSGKSTFAALLLRSLASEHSSIQRLWIQLY